MVTGINASVGFSVQDGGQARVYSDCYVTGIIVDPLVVNPDTNPWCAFLRDNGIRSDVYFSLINTNDGGGRGYTYDENVSLYSYNLAGLFTVDGEGFFGNCSSQTYGYGMIPLSSTVSIGVYDPKDGGDKRFYINMRSEWLVVASFHLTTVPAPSALSLVGLGGLVSARRRRS